VTGLVNSVGHRWGRRRFETPDDSRNVWWAALITFGDSWHNNHHAHPGSARHGLAWHEVDINWYCIRVMRRLGLVQRVHIATLPKEPALSRTGS
jgi:stearoyl-CoA desaturase (delta-9 desaturase)